MRVRLFLLFFRFPDQHAWPFFKLRQEAFILLACKNERSDLDLDIAFIFSAQIVKMILVNVSHQHEVYDASILASSLASKGFVRPSPKLSAGHSFEFHWPGDCLH